MKIKSVFALLLATFLLLLAACSPKAPTTPDPAADPTDYIPNAIALFELMREGKFEEATANFDEKMKSALSAAKLKEGWDATVEGMGDFVLIEKQEQTEKQGFQTVVLSCAFENNGLLVTTVFDNEGKTVGINLNFYNPTTKQIPLPSSLEEKDIAIGKGSKWELAGKITAQKGKQSKSAVVLVHGSGPQDMDETIFANKPFRDIAWGLAEKGVDVLRYNKRTHTHGAALMEAEYATFTVKQETIEDAILAGKLLQEQGYEHIYLAGHSLGGMLALRIDKDSEGLFDGIISLAGSPRTLVDIMLDQNADSIATMTDAKQIEESKALVKAEEDKLPLLSTWTEDELKSNTLFSMPAVYIKDLYTNDVSVLAKAYQKPILILQGEKDFQVYATKDYVLWQEVLKDNAKAEFILYPNLSHLFITAQEPTNSIEGYKVPGQVAQQVIDDMAAFVVKHST